jgi:type I restriction enzyme, R subunit
VLRLPDEDVTYAADDLDRAVVAKDQIRLIAQTFRDKLPGEIFPGRTEVPKTLVFAKDDSHAEDIVEIFRQVFGRGNDFCQKITYKTTGRRTAKQLIQDFRIDYAPRIAVTVDMIATGTDIKPIEIVMFMRSVKSRKLFEQMKGRGVRVIDSNDLKAVTPDAKAKTHFVIVDCVGVTECELADTQPLERSKAVAFKALMEHVALGGSDPDLLSSLASRLARLDRQCGKPEKEKIREVSEGLDISDVSHSIVMALDPDEQIAVARRDNSLSDGSAPTEEQIQAAKKKLLTAAVAPLATKPQLRKLLIDVKKSFDQIIDEVSKDELLTAGYSADAKEKAKALVQNFQTFIEENKEEIDALRFFYSQPHGERLSLKDIKNIHDAITAPPRSWTPEKLWSAYQTIEEHKVKGASAERRLTDLVSLIRFALNKDEELVPFSSRVEERFTSWMAQQENKKRAFTDDQRRWLEMLKTHVMQSVGIDVDDFSYAPFVQEGGLGKAVQIFGDEFHPLIRELNEVLAA